MTIHHTYMILLVLAAGTTNGQAVSNFTYQGYRYGCDSDNNLIHSRTFFVDDECTPYGDGPLSTKTTFNSSSQEYSISWWTETDCLGGKLGASSSELDTCHFVGNDNNYVMFSSAPIYDCDNAGDIVCSTNVGNGQVISNFTYKNFEEGCDATNFLITAQTMQVDDDVCVPYGRGSAKAGYLSESQEYFIRLWWSLNCTGADVGMKTGKLDTCYAPEYNFLSTYNMFSTAQTEDCHEYLGNPCASNGGDSTYVANVVIAVVAFALTLHI